MKKFPILIGVITVLIIVGGVFLASKNSSPKTYPPPVNPTYYWGNGCPHCANVEEFLNSWDPPAGEAGKKVQIDKKEVWGSSANARELEARYEYCKITNPSEMGVPLLFTPDGKCYSGDVEIINYLKNIEL